MGQPEFEERHGKWARTPWSGNRWANIAIDRSVFPGSFFTGGVYLRPGRSPTNLPWAKLEADVTLVTPWVMRLKEHGIVHSSRNTSEYFPIVFPDRLEPGENFCRSLLHALGVENEPFLTEYEPDLPPRVPFPHVAELPKVHLSFFTAEAIESDRTNAVDEQALADVEQCQAVRRSMKTSLKGHVEFALLTGFDTFVMFSIGQAETGHWLGLFFPISDRDFMTDWEQMED
jgi:hypothetical protein